MGQCFSCYVINMNRRNKSSAGTLVLRSISQITHKFINLDTAIERFISMCVNILVLLSFTLDSLSPAEQISARVSMNGNKRPTHCVQN
jgi:hypothetical protein